MRRGTKSIKKIISVTPSETRDKVYKKDYISDSQGDERQSIKKIISVTPSETRGKVYKKDYISDSQ